ncbi:hypothetical protein Ancab_003747 [Ancistrocladus abbreviatus]
MSTRGWSSSPFSYRRASSLFSSSSSTSSFMNTSGKFVPRSCSTSGSSFYGSANRYGARSTTPNRNQIDPMYAATRGYSGRSPVGFPTSEELSGEPLDVPRSAGDSISVTVRFRPMNDREHQRGNEISWYSDGDKIVHSEYNPATAYAFDKVFGPNAKYEEVYEVAAQPVVKAAMEGVNGWERIVAVIFVCYAHNMRENENGNCTLELDLSLNRLSGSIPPDKLSDDMTTIILSNNGLTGAIPANFSGLPHLQKLLLADNSLNGYVPSSIWQSRKLNATKRLILDFQNNMLSGISGSLKSQQTYLSCKPLDYISTTSDGHFKKNEFQEYLSSGLYLYLNQLDIDSFVWQEGPRLKMYLKLFPVFNVHANNSHIFNASEVMRIWRMFTGWNIRDSKTFGPYELLNFTLLDPYKAGKS